MGLADSLRKFVASINTEYDRRIKLASNVKEYDPTGASHDHGHVEVHNEHVEAVDAGQGGNGHAASEPTQTQQSDPRSVTHSHR